MIYIGKIAARHFFHECDEVPQKTKDVLTPVLVVMKCFAVFAELCGESGTCRKSKGCYQGKRKQTVQKTKFSVSDQTINFDSVPDDEASQLLFTV